MPARRIRRWHDGVCADARGVQALPEPRPTPPGRWPGSASSTSPPRPLALPRQLPALRAPPRRRRLGPRQPRRAADRGASPTCRPRSALAMLERGGGDRECGAPGRWRRRAEDARRRSGAAAGPPPGRPGAPPSQPRRPWAIRGQLAERSATAEHSRDAAAASGPDVAARSGAARRRRDIRRRLPLPTAGRAKCGGTRRSRNSRSASYAPRPGRSPRRRRAPRRSGARASLQRSVVRLGRGSASIGAGLISVERSRACGP